MELRQDKRRKDDLMGTNLNWEQEEREEEKQEKEKEKKERVEEDKEEQYFACFCGYLSGK